MSGVERVHMKPAQTIRPPTITVAAARSTERTSTRKMLERHITAPQRLNVRPGNPLSIRLPPAHGGSLLTWVMKLCAPPAYKALLCPGC